MRSNILRRCGAAVLTATLALGLAATAATEANAARPLVHSSWWNGPHAQSDCIRSSNNYVNQNGWRIVRSCYQLKSTNQYPTYKVEFVKS